MSKRIEHLTVSIYDLIPHEENYNQHPRSIGFTSHMKGDIRRNGPSEEWNLITLCPNHHTMADRGLLTQEELFRYVQAASQEESHA